MGTQIYRTLFTSLALATLVVGTTACTQTIGGGDIDKDPETDGDGGVQASCECVGCITQSVGIGAANPFDTNVDDSEFVGVDDLGALVVDKGNSKYNRYLWVADTNLPGAVKIDIETFSIVGRYRTPGSSTSRTTVNALGEAFVGARSGSFGVTKILPDGLDCPDTNGDGVITTSTGPNDVLALGQDDCVAWTTGSLGDIRGLAAQDIPGTAPAMCDAGEFPMDVPDQHYVWIGGLHGKIYKLDAKTGQLLMTLDAPSTVYGMALSGDGKLWTGQGLAFIDTTLCTDEATCNAAPVCQQTCSESNCPATCDGAVKATISGVSGYGITVDCKDRVWMSSGATSRYDPNGAVNQRLALGPNSGGGGIAADANGWIWASNYTSTVRINSETLEGTTIAAPNKGVAVDSTGRVITVQNTGVHLIEPGPTLEDYTLTNDVTQLMGFAYAYSDMTGVQTRLASDEPGWYRRTFEGCDSSPETSWRVLDWDVETPAGTFSAFYARSADSVEDLEDAAWTPVASCTEGEGCKNLQETKRFLEIEVRLDALAGTSADAMGCSDETGESARIKRFDVRYSCGSVVE